PGRERPSARPANATAPLLASAAAAAASGQPTSGSGWRPPAGHASGDTVQRYRYENSHAAKSIAATRISTPVAQLECAETPGGVVVGSTTPPPTSAGDPAGPGSVSHTQTRMAPIASAAQTSAGTTSFTVSRKKPIAVAAAAS